MILAIANGVVLIDDEDLKSVENYNWYCVSSRNTQYAQCDLEDGSCLQMHRLLLGQPSELVDHRNRNGLDNRRANLRTATPRQNAINAVAPQTSKGSGFRGVRQRGNRFMAYIKAESYKQISVGTFDTVEEAARAYDAAARREHGEFAVLNFPEEECSNG